jgi:beta-N-acetylhexosaminidase
MNKASIMLDIEGFSLSIEDRALIKSKHVGGIILFSRNFESREQLIDLCFEIKSIKPEILIATDQEGGRVQRFKEGFSIIPSMQRLGDLVAHDVEGGLSLCRRVGWLMASEMIATGIDISFAPVLDLDKDTSSVIGDRSFSEQIDIVISSAKAFIFGMAEAGMASTGKHFPGHGGIEEDSHLVTPIDNRSLSDLESNDLIPYRELVEVLDGVMTAHITFPKIDASVVSFSSEWIQTVLRENLNFQGMVFSDDLTMKGADTAGNYTNKAKLSVNAGCDMILICNDRDGAKEILKFFEENNIPKSEKVYSMLMSNDVSWKDLEKTTLRDEIRTEIDNLIS